MATREQSKLKQLQVCELYRADASIGEIQATTHYTESMIYHILQKHNVPRRQEQIRSTDPDIDRLMPDLVASRAAAHRILQRCTLLEDKPNLALAGDEWMRLGLKPAKRKTVEVFLSKLGLCIMPTPYPALFDLKNNRYYRLTYREVVFLYANPEKFLAAEAENIKKGWKVDKSVLESK